MQFRAQFKKGIRDGRISVTYRHWKRPQASAGGIYRLSPDDGIEVTALEQVTETDITDHDARRAGFDAAADLLRYLDGRPDDRHLYRVAFRYLKHLPDPRVTLRAQPLAADSLDSVARRLDRMDQRSKGGAWTRRVLRLIDARPGFGAADLAPALALDTATFKTRVRRLKALGLTESLEVGYRLSPRGESFLAGDDRPGHEEAP